MTRSESSWCSNDSKACHPETPPSAVSGPTRSGVDTAWATTQMLWQQRNNRVLLGMTERTLEETVGTTGRMLVTPVVPPPK